MSPEEAMGKAMERLRGAFALVALFSGRHDILMGARRGSSLAVGYGDGAMYHRHRRAGVGALHQARDLSRGRRLGRAGCQGRHDLPGARAGEARDPPERHLRRHDGQGQSPPLHAEGDLRAARGDRRHPADLPRSDDAFGAPAGAAVRLEQGEPGHHDRPAARPSTPAWSAKYWFEKLARLPVEVEVASEFRYREPPLPEGGVCIAVSQSGETVDTLAALRYARAHKQTILSVVNVPESAIARESHVVLPTLAGPEIGVASTKAFTTQLTVLLAAAMAAGRARGVLLERRGGAVRRMP